MIRNKSIVFAASICFLVLIQSCQKDEIVDNIDLALQPYFEKFKTEAALRGMAVDYEEIGITASLTRISDPAILGQCIHNVKTPDKIIISRIYWNQIDTLKREFLVFHELGHCILDRSHLDTKDAAGNCTSIMHSSEDICIFKYSGLARKNYLDELFKQ